MSSPTARTQRQTSGLLLGGILLVTMLVFSGAVNYGFVYDDPLQITENEYVQSWEHVPRYFTGHVWQQTGAVTGTYYRPLFLLWLRVQHAAFGLNPAPWHMASLLLHLAVVALVFLLSRKLLRDVGAAALATGIFAMHPAHIESVVWVSGSPDLLMGLFLIPSVIVYLHWLEQRRAGLYVLSLVFGALAMLCKEPAVVLPVLLMACEFFTAKGQGTWRERMSRALRHSGAFWGLSVAYLAARAAALSGFGEAAVPNLDWGTLLLTSPMLAAFYLKQMLWPVGLAVAYDLSYVTSAISVKFLLPLLLLVALAAAAVFATRREPRVAAALAFLLLLLPAFYLRAFTPSELAHDRYLYLPLLALCLLAGLGYAWLSQRAGVAWLGGVALLGALAVGTATQHIHWASDLTLFARAAQAAPRNTLVLNNLAIEMSKRGHNQEAIALYQQALAVAPQDWLSNYNLGHLLYTLGDLQHAEPYLRVASQYRQINKPSVYLGFTLFKLRRWDEAEAVLKQALAIEPRALGIRLPLAISLAAQGRRDEAAATLREELQLNPNDAQAKAELARLGG